LFGKTKQRIAELESKLLATSAQLSAIQDAGDDGESALAGDGYDGLVQIFGAEGTHAGPVVTPETAMKASVVFACTRVIAGAIASMPIHIYERTADGRRRVAHDIWWLLNEQPAPEWTAASFWERVVADSLLQGDGFAEILRKRGGQVAGFVRLDPRAVTVRRAGGRLHYLIFDPETGQSRGLDQDDVCHFPGFGFDGLRGMSVIRYAAYQALGIAFAAEEHSARFLANGAKPSIVISLQGAVTSEQEQKFQDKLQRSHSGTGVFRPLVLGKGASATTLNLSPQDAQLLESRAFQVEEICRAFGVPPFMVGANDKTGPPAA
jgi:HK97 family phage portal protein